MKLTPTLIFFLSLLLLFTSDVLCAGEISVTYRFEGPRVVDMGGGFSRIEFDQTVQAGKPGEPTFPFRGAQILLPPGEMVSGVTIDRKGWRVIGGEHKLHPKQYTVPGLERDGHGNGFLIKHETYEIDSWIHPPASKFSTHYLRGHAIAGGSFCPVGFLPAAREVGYFSEVVVRIETYAAGSFVDAAKLLRSDQDTRSRIERLVDNPLSVQSYPRDLLQSPEDSYEYLIITKEGFADDFIPLRDFYTRRGMRAQIMTVEEIETGYSGTDTAEKIRNAIIHEYTTHDITHVLLGGDGDGPPADPKIVPYRGLYCIVQSSVLYEDDNIPADCYFAGLDGTWNGDEDSLWGEPGEEDFYSEIAVGRACVDSPEEIANFINKTMMYQQQPVESQARAALMLGEHLWSSPLTYGGDEMDQLIGTCTAYGFTTTGIPGDYDITKYYDRDLGSWSKTIVIDAINAGTNWVSHAGHSNHSYVMRLVRSDITDVTFSNDGDFENFPLIYTYGCYAGSFDNRGTSVYDTEDCIGEMMVSIAHCAAAILCNSRYGWFTEGTTNGPSHHFQREFFDAMFTEGITSLGAANERSKDETAPFIDLPGEYEPGAHRWCFYALNLIGDPVLDGWTDAPESLDVDHGSSIMRGDTIFEIDTGVGGAVASLYRHGVCYGRGTADGTGHIDLCIFPGCPDSIPSVELNVCAHNRYTYRDSVFFTETSSAELTPHTVTLEQNVPNPFNPSTQIRFTLAAGHGVDVRIYDVAGREVDRFGNEYSKPGRYTINWRPENLPSGVYFCVLRAGNIIRTRKMVLIR